MKKETKLVNAGRDYKKQSGSVNPPIYQSSTVLFPSVQAYEDAGNGKNFYNETSEGTSSDFGYGISGTPTTFALQKAISDLEGEGQTVITGSGLSAITLSLYSFLKAGDHILMVDTVYGPTRRFCNKELKRFGVETTYYDPLIGAGIKNLIKANTKLVFIESPGSLTFEVQDIPLIIRTIKNKNSDIVTVMDNSWATPLYFQPFNFDVDVSIQAITKYIGGHSDILLGAVSFKAKHRKEILSAYRNIGFTSSPHDCYYALRGLRTLSVRLKQHQENALELCKWLKTRKEVKDILFPAFKGNYGYEIWKRDFSGAGGLFSIILDKNYSEKSISNFIDKLELFGIGCSWGGYESLILPVHPETVRTATKWHKQGSCIRIYAGLENPGDLIKDLEKGFKRLS